MVATSVVIFDIDSTAKLYDLMREEDVVIAHREMKVALPRD